MSQDARKKVMDLIARRMNIEQRIQEFGNILTRNGLGMDEPLVDEEGFPLSNIDIYAVRHARVEIIRLQNDYKVLMREIENGLNEYYNYTDNASNSISNEYYGNINKKDLNNNGNDESYIPFAKITNVVPQSPAYESGLQNDDFILKFGSVTKDNFINLSNIGTMVQHSIGNNIEVKILRDGTILTFNLIPQRWVGIGLLGCSISPVNFTNY